MSRPRYSIIVPAYNAEHTIGACVTALCAQSFDQAYEVIVVDDGSTDNTANVASAAGAKVISIPNARPAAARNAGIFTASGEIVCCTDADCIPHSDWLLHITAPFADIAIVACKGIYETHQTELIARFVQLEYEDKYDLLRSEKYIDFIDTYSAAYRRDVLLKCGGFDERFNYLEDQELSFRLAAQGHKMVFQPAAVVDHLHSATLSAYLRKKQIIGYWKAHVVRRFPERAIKDSHTPQVMKLQMLFSVLLIGMILLGITGVALAPKIWGLAGWLAFLPAIAVALAFMMTTLPFARKAWPKDRAVALASPALLLGRALALSAGYARGWLAPGQQVEHL